MRPIRRHSASSTSVSFTWTSPMSQRDGDFLWTRMSDSNIHLHRHTDREGSGHSGYAHRNGHPEQDANTDTNDNKICDTDYHHVCHTYHNNVCDNDYHCNANGKHHRYGNGNSNKPTIANSNSYDNTDSHRHDYPHLHANLLVLRSRDRDQHLLLRVRPRDPNLWRGCRSGRWGGMRYRRASTNWNGRRSL